MIVDQTGSGLDGIFPGIERTEAVVQFTISLVMGFIGRKVDGGAECTGAVGRSAYSTLNLYTVDGGSKVGQVYKISDHAFCIVVRNAVECYVDPGGIGAADMNGCIAYTITGIGIHNG